jgi:hypothetical protein
MAAKVCFYGSKGMFLWPQRYVLMVAKVCYYDGKVAIVCGGGKCLF